MNDRGRLVEPILRDGLLFVVEAVVAATILALGLGAVGIAFGVAIAYVISGRRVAAAIRDLRGDVLVTTGVITSFLSNLDGDKDFIVVEPGGKFWIRASDTDGWANQGMLVHVWHYPRSRVATAVREVQNST